VQIIDSSPQHNQTTYAFDALDRQTSMTDQLGNHGTMTYDAAGRLMTSKDRDGRTRNFSYDALNRKTGETWLNSSQATVNLLTYGYDAADNLLTSADYHGAYGEKAGDGRCIDPDRGADGLTCRDRPGPLGRHPP
jgi:YD repeat-containing protein